MKILYSHRTRSADGQYVHIRELTNALLARGHEIVMAGPGGKQETQNKDLHAGGGAVRTYVPRMLYEIVERAYATPAFWRLRDAHQRAKPDVLYERYNLFFNAGVRLKRKEKLPFLLEVNAPLADERATYGGLALSGSARKSERAIWRAADAVLPVTKVLADRICAAGVPEEKIQVIHNGVNENFLKEKNPTRVREQYGLAQKIVLGFTGFVRPWHGVDRVVRFLAAHPNDDIHFLIVGDGPARADLEKLAVELGVAEKVTITGVVQRENLSDYVAAFDIALQPAVVEYASPLKLFEYMALAKPILAPDNANIGEILSDEEDALLFNTQVAESFDNKLLALINTPDLRARLGGAARESLIRQDLTWGAAARRVEVVAERLLRKQ